METLHNLQMQYPWFIKLIVLLLVWEAVWKIIALWKAASNKHLVWFICIAVINTVGILPIIYIFTHLKYQSKQSIKDLIKE